MHILNEITSVNSKDKTPFDLLHGSLNLALGDDKDSALSLTFYCNDLYNLMEVMNIDPVLIQKYKEYRRIDILTRSWERSSNDLETPEKGKVYLEEEEDAFSEFHYNFNERRDFTGKKEIFIDDLDYEINHTMPTDKKELKLFIQSIDRFAETWLPRLEAQIPKDAVWADKGCKEMKISKERIVFNETYGFQIEGDKMQMLFDKVRDHLVSGVSVIVENRLPKLQKDEENMNKFIKFLNDKEYKTIDFTKKDEAFKFICMQISVVSWLQIWS